MAENLNDKRICGSCSKPAIPRGVDWPLWKDGKPICVHCHLFTLPIPATLPPCPACGAMVAITHFKTVTCIDCTYDAGGPNDTEDEGIRKHLLCCQRLGILVPVVPDGWKLVPKSPDDAMWKAGSNAYIGNVTGPLGKVGVIWDDMLAVSPEYKPPAKEPA